MRHSGFGLLLAGGTLCNDAIQQRNDKQPALTVVLGDPTETALVTAASDLGLLKTDLERLMPRVGEIPFTSERKRMTTVHRLPAAPPPFPIEVAAPHRPNGLAYVAFTKGAPAELLRISGRVWIDGKIQPLSESFREHLSQATDELAGKGMRVLGVAFRYLDSLPASMDDEAIERDLTFVGLVGMIDPPRPRSCDCSCNLRGGGNSPGHDHR